MSESANSTVTLNGARNLGVGALVVGGAFCVTGMLTNDNEKFLASYLFAYVLWMALTLGCLGLQLLLHTVRGSWGAAVVRIYEAGGGPLSFIGMAFAFVPIALNMDTLYHHWMHPAKGDMILAHKAAWLNEPAFLIRTGIYFAIWFGLAAFMRASTLAQEKSGNSNEISRRNNLAAPGLVLFVVSVTFAITDWVMSLDPHWFSTIFGVWYLVSGVLGALALGAIIVCRNAKAEPYRGIISPQLTKDLGNLMLAFTMFWCYVSLSQFIIIWSGNLPEFITYYKNRGTFEWTMFGAFNIFVGFFVPFLLLLFPRTKAVAQVLLPVAALLFAMRFSDMYYHVIPAMRSTLFNVWDLAALVGVGGVWTLMFGIQIRQAPLVPNYDTRLVEAKAKHAH
ncbi:MAG TPA: hypothetical protein PLH94_01180 [Fimbriimonadaceae bacterium]|nr:hypothetical protein [Fimbriimonadaceae bacterium]